MNYAEANKAINDLIEAISHSHAGDGYKTFCIGMLVSVKQYLSRFYILLPAKIDEDRQIGE